MTEEFKPIKGYEDKYMVSNLGRVYSIKRKIYLASGDNHGYRVVELCKDGKIKRKLVHRLVAEAFLENPNHLPQVNHKDKNRANNSVDNLEWCTAAYNAQYRTLAEQEILYKKAQAELDKLKSRFVRQYTLDNEYVATYESISAAARAMGVSKQNIWMVVTGQQHTACGYRWQKSTT